MRCPICKQEIKDNSKFCSKCGNVVPRCPSCGKVIEKKIRFCVFDGTPLPEEMIALIPEEGKKEVVDLKKKKKVWPIILIFISIFLVAGALVIGYLLYDSGKIELFGNKKNNPETEVYTEQESDEQEIEETEIEENIDDVSEENTDVNVEDSEETVEDSADMEVNLNVNVEESVLEIREAYNDIVEEINGKTYDKKVAQNGVITYSDNGEIKAIIVPGNTDGTVYTRSFYYDNTGLFFAYYEADDAHRLYFVNGNLIRWRYSANAEKAQDAQNHDLESSPDYEYWSVTAKNESAYFWQLVQFDESMVETDYILEGSDSRYLDKDELDGMSADECRLARNELYARHGRLFDDEFLRAYFEQKDWYVGTIASGDFTEDMLNEYEVYNRDLIVAYEEEMGYR